MANGKQVYLVDGKRTPQAKAGKEFKTLPPWYLGSILLRHLLDNTPIGDDQVDEVICGNTGAGVEFPNIARVMAMAAGLHPRTPALTVQRNCASGMEALTQGFVQIASERANIILAAGVESISQMPLIYGPELATLVKNWMSAKNITGVLGALLPLRLNFLRPLPAVNLGTKDVISGLSMGMAGEYLANRCRIGRQEQDAWALMSHQRATSWQQQYQQEGRMPPELVPILGGEQCQQLIYRDLAVRENTSLEKLAALAPAFDRRGGTITSGNSSSLADGGACCLLASEVALQRYQLTPLARIVDFAYQGIEAKMMGMGPLLAIHQLLAKTNLSCAQIDLWEINEAFAAQLLAVQKAMTESAISQLWHLPALGELPAEKLNVNGGSIALGHPFGSTGNRLIVTLAHTLARRKLRWGIAAICVGGGQGGAVLLENLHF